MIVLLGLRDAGFSLNDIGKLDGRAEVEVGDRANPGSESLRSWHGGRRHLIDEQGLLDRSSVALAKETAQVHLRTVEGLTGVEHGDALARDIGFSLKLLEHRRVAERALGADLGEQGFRRALARLAQGNQSTGAGEGPIGDFGIADEVEGGRAQSEAIAIGRLTRRDQRAEVHRAPAAGEEWLRVGDVGAKLVS